MKLNLSNGLHTLLPVRCFYFKIPKLGHLRPKRANLSRITGLTVVFDLPSCQKDTRGILLNYSNPKGLHIKAFLNYSKGWVQIKDNYSAPVEFL